MNFEKDNLIVTVNSLLYHDFHHYNYLNYSDYSFPWLFAVVPDKPPSPEQQQLPDSSWFVVDETTPLLHAFCGPLAHVGRAPQAQRYRRSRRSRQSR